MATYIGFGTSSPSASNYELQLRRLENAHDRSANAATAYSRELDAWRLAHPGQPDNLAIVANINAQNQATKALGSQIIQLLAVAHNVDASAIQGALDLSRQFGRVVSPQEYAQRVNAHNASFATPLPPKYSVGRHGVSDLHTGSESKRRLVRASAVEGIVGTVAPYVAQWLEGAQGTAKAIADYPNHPLEHAKVGARADWMFLRGVAQFTGAEVIGEEVLRGTTSVGAAEARLAARVLPGWAGNAARNVAKLDSEISNKMQDLAEGSTDAAGNFTPRSVNGFVGFLPWTVGDMVNSFGGGVIPAAIHGGADAATDAVLNEDPAQFANDAMMLDGMVRGGVHIGEFAKSGIAKLRQSAPPADAPHGIVEGDSEPGDEPEPRQTRRLIKAASKGPYGRPRRMSGGRGKQVSNGRVLKNNPVTAESNAEPRNNESSSPALTVARPEQSLQDGGRLAPGTSRIFVHPDDVRGPNGETLDLRTLFVDGTMYGASKFDSGDEHFFESGIRADMSPENFGRFVIRARNLAKATHLGNILAAGPGKAVLAVLNPIAMLGNPEVVVAAMQESQRSIEAGAADEKHISDLITMAARLARVHLPDLGQKLVSPLDIDPFSLKPKQLTRFMFHFGGDPEDDDITYDRVSHGVMSNRRLIDLINDYKGTRRGAIVHVVQYNPDNTAPVYLGDIGKNGMPSAFPWGIPGFGVGDIARSIPFEVAHADFIDGRGDSEFRHTFWTAQLRNPSVRFTNQLIDDYVQGGRHDDYVHGAVQNESQANDSPTTGDVGADEGKRSEVSQNAAGGRRVRSTRGADTKHAGGHASYGRLRAKAGGAAGITKQRNTSQTAPSEAIQTQSDVALQPNSAILTALISQTEDAIGQSGMNMFDTYRGAPKLTPQQKRRHIIPASPTIPAGPLLTTSAVAAHRAMRTAYLG